MILRLVLIVCSVSGAASVSTVLKAQEVDEARARADVLFESGLKSKDGGDMATACAQFEASVAAAPTPHGWLQVGSCREQRDLLGALESFEAALVEARRLPQGQRRTAYESAARERIARLSPRVPTVTFLRSPTPRASADLTREDRDLTTIVDRFDEPLRASPGRYRVRIWAAGYHSSRLDVELSEAQQHVVALPALQPLAVTPPPAAPPPAAPLPVQPSGMTGPVSTRAAEHEGGARIGALPIALLGGGLALVAGGIVSGQVSSAERDELRRECAGVDPETGRRRCGAELAGTKKRMEDFALLADVAWVGGVLLAGAGVAVFLLEDDPAHPARVAVGCFMAGCGVSTEGRF